MSDVYSVVMTGKIAEGMALPQVKANVGKLFKLSDEKLEKLFSGKPVAVRRGIDRQQADKICAALSKAGAIANVKASRPLATAEKAPVSDRASVKPAVAAPAKKSKPVSPKAPVKASKEAASKDGFSPDLDCPRCGHHQAFATACGLCKMDLTLHIQRLKRKEQARALRQQAAS